MPAPRARLVALGLLAAALSTTPSASSAAAAATDAAAAVVRDAPTVQARPSAVQRSTLRSRPRPVAVETAPAVRSWLTTTDQRSLLRPVTGLAFGVDSLTAANRVVVDDGVRGQVFRGAGAALTESSAAVLGQLPADTRDAVLRRLFSPTDGIGLSLLRQPFGASDFALSDYTFDDVPRGATDPTLARFSIARDAERVLPLLRRARALQPALSVVATPWSAPAWMKASGTTHGGTLDPAWHQAYADYLARAVADYRAQGVPVRALTLANEPLHSTPWYPSMTLSPAQEIDLAARRLPAALAARGVTGLSVLGYDHNWDNTAYPKALLADPEGSAAFTGVAFHCYAGQPSAQAEVAAAAPGKEIWMTECSGGRWAPSFASNLTWAAHNLIIGNLRSSGASLLQWNLALDRDGGPTNGGCADCRGVVTVDPTSGSVAYEVEYYVLGQVTKAVQPGAVRVGSGSWGTGRMESVAFRNPDGTHAVVLHNNAGSEQSVSVVHGGRALRVKLPAGAIQTLLW